MNVSSRRAPHGSSWPSPWVLLWRSGWTSCISGGTSRGCQSCHTSLGCRGRNLADQLTFLSFDVNAMQLAPKGLPSSGSCTDATNAWVVDLDTDCPREGSTLWWWSRLLSITTQASSPAQFWLMTYWRSLSKPWGGERPWLGSCEMVCTWWSSDCFTVVWLMLQRCLSAHLEGMHTHEFGELVNLPLSQSASPWVHGQMMKEGLSGGDCPFWRNTVKVKVAASATMTTWCLVHPSVGLLAESPNSANGGESTSEGQEWGVDATRC
jgi:hypothetical protein